MAFRTSQVELLVLAFRGEGGCGGGGAAGGGGIAGGGGVAGNCTPLHVEVCAPHHAEGKDGSPLHGLVAAHPDLLFVLQGRRAVAVV